MWRELGGEGDTIALYGMGRQFGTHEEFVRLLGLEGVVAGGFQGYPWPYKIVHLVAENPDGLAFLPLGNLLDLDPTLATVRLLAVDGVTPMNTNDSRDRYALIRPLELITLGPPQGAAKVFVDFMGSSDGQALLRAHHFIRERAASPVGARPPPVPPDTDR
jgi:phosphate transport system substrate-binding protein